MKTGLGLYIKYREFFAYKNLFLFWLRKRLLGFDVANQFIQRVDKFSLKLILCKNGAQIDDNCDIETGLIFHNCKDYSNLIVGRNCHIGKNCFFDLRDRVEIGNNVVIAMRCNFITHIDMSKSDLSNEFPASQSRITINDHCYIGVNSTILKGVTLGRRSFIGAKSLVLKDVNSDAMVVGVPAKFIRHV